MTNGEKIQQMFPNAEISYGLRGVVAVTFIHKTIFDLDWWNDEYKEPTDKIDCDHTDCINCVNHKYCDYESSSSGKPNKSEVGSITKKCTTCAYREIDGKPHEMCKSCVCGNRYKQEPKIGHWIMTSDYLTTAYGSVDYVKCSCCGEDSLEEGDYCPNCGAKMEEVEE